MNRLSALSNDALLHDLHVFVGHHRALTAKLVLYLGEVDARRLHVDQGFSSLFSYCVEKLHFSEDEACRRIDAARLARRFPAIPALLETGSVSLTVLALLKPYLSDENHRELLAGVSGCSTRRAKEWLAARFPEPDVPSSIRKRPERRRGTTSSPAVATVPPAPASPPSGNEEACIPVTEVPPAAPRIDWAPAVSLPARARVEPLSRDRFFVKFTASREFRDKLELARDLMSHANPGGDLAIVLERAVDLLVTHLEKRKLGRASGPRMAPPPAPASPPRQASASQPATAPRPATAPQPANAAPVTRAVRREVVARDGVGCSFVADDGRRCGARPFLEFDHEVPKGRGGGSGAANLRLLCRPHNRALAEQTYGKAHVSRAIEDSRRRTALARGPHPAERVT